MHCLHYFLWCRSLSQGLPCFRPPREPAPHVELGRYVRSLEAAIDRVADTNLRLQVRHLVSFLPWMIEDASRVCARKGGDASLIAWKVLQYRMLSPPSRGCSFPSALSATLGP